MTYETIIVATEGRVGVITMNRPEALNALNHRLTSEIGTALKAFDADEAIGCIVLTGAGKAFAAGADIKEMAPKSFADVYAEDFITATWEALTVTRKPVIAAVNGFALGGGCEFALMCDTAFAADTAKFGQPEIKLGVIPGAGGTQRLTRAVGKAVAMDMILTGRMIDAAEALRIGLVARVYPADELMAETMKAAAQIAGYGLLSVLAAKEATNRAFETTLAEGVRFERRLFHGLFGTADQKEGMAAFVDKRAAGFTHR
ncbi:enoyl-CoA hydratase [Glacieibacterium frigidum]|uniref:enoyl-CoA hydratase n=1 Tax=Glacieibacterium frigidum TaxID=2593303 RepID=A0A552U841_9SPHN|nr:enoyl-CoA hydratase [Glacieibacterium frigidum]TRW14388.1 enoyl-CoA hydratase [Glacieibacterium frigidum]